MHAALIEAARRLRQAERDGKPCAPVRELIASALAADPSIDPVALAYAVQQYNNTAAIEAGQRPVGRKVGLTSRAVQQQLGVDQPDFGQLFASMARGDDQPIAWSDTRQPKVEAEIALVLEHDLCHERHTVADLIRATAFALPAIEVVGSRIAQWDIQLVDTIADNASSGLFVLGTRPVQLSRLDLVRCGMSMTLGAEPVSVGAGAACLGNPLNAAVWLADTLARLGTPLRAGDILLTGALGPMVAARPGNVFTAHIQGLGSVTAAFDLQS
ncbi:2-keto-4-pentenoate hydratase [Pseudomonas taetrolens]|uniref:2-keto-4-pentenoate hydratase n=1 Tax=Pseudomonas taetrolens TaxID=47884 RepID=A0A0J6GU57_PSETA|nr:fumarylacetoacetate hydrolase family protein [Pseudomonas taetrolens]KMM85225.1 2-keto-4-pentenoate hydratase [Pseudomonas taetrolens]SEC42470.1 2-keto-4-pentenoate hydratase [Pseudomonas taetrolens]SQF86541.1 4-oxalocrotonate decarboxylase [Pseudomonas taetrolens]VEH49618.1 4-oxalocrotonate decarboxylase [Pseudomonas taetrolens]